MSRFTRAALVVANPWFALDHKGRPCGVVPYEPHAVGGHLGFVGARVDRSRSVGGKKEPGHVVPPVHETVYEFSEVPARVPRTPYYQELVRSGHLLAADEATSRWAGMRKFVSPETRLEEARRAVEEKFDRDYGQGSLAELRAQVAETEGTTFDPPPASDVQAPAPPSEQSPATEAHKPHEGSDEEAGDEEPHVPRSEGSGSAEAEDQEALSALSPARTKRRARTTQRS